jgi:ATP-dependent Zn protease
MPSPDHGEREYSNETARSVDVEVRTLLEAADERARATLAQHEEALQALRALARR